MNILHCDLDAFYASVEQRDNPALLGKPVIVGGHPGSRGVVSACSYEARKYGVHSAMPANQAYRLCPQAVFILPDINKYITISQQVFAILERYSPIIEPVSIDEAFLDVSGCHHLFGSSMEIAQMIKKTVWEETSLAISVGIAANKFLAKLATNLSKPNGLLEIGEEQIKEILPSLPVTNIWGIGSKTADRLNKIGIFTISDLQGFPRGKLKAVLGSNTDFFIQLCTGQDSRPVLGRSEQKSIGNEITFSQDLEDKEVIEQLLLELSSQVAYRVRHSSLIAHTVTIKMRTPDFHTVTRSQTLQQGVDADLTIYDIALNLYHKSGLAGKCLRLLGLSCSKLIARTLEQPALFADENDTLDQIMDDMKNKFGIDTIKRGSLLNTSTRHR